MVLHKTILLQLHMLAGIMKALARVMTALLCMLMHALFS